MNWASKSKMRYRDFVAFLFRKALAFLRGEIVLMDMA